MVQWSDVGRVFEFILAKAPERDCRCRKCGAALCPGAESDGLSPTAHASDSRTAGIYLRCLCCGSRGPIPNSLERGITQDLVKPRPPLRQLAVNTCPDCGQEMHPEGGCFFCRACGFSRCG